MENKRLMVTVAVTGLLLMVPLVSGAPWTLSDYVIAGALLLGTGLLYDLAARKAAQTNVHVAYKAGAAVALGAAFLLTWANLAVGVIGNEDNPVNLMFFGVVAIGLIGAGIARFQPRGMSLAMFATALAQFLVPLIAMAIFRPPFNSGVVAVLGINAVFVLLFAGSGLLFRHAAEPGRRGSNDQVEI